MIMMKRDIVIFHNVIDSKEETDGDNIDANS